MNDYIGKVIDLYTKSELGEPLKSEFHKWLVDSESSAGKEAGLFRLWNRAHNAATEDTLVSLVSMQAKVRSYKERKHTKLVAWRYVAAIALVIIVSSAYIFTKKTAHGPDYIEYFSDSKQFGDTMVLPDGSIVLANTGTVILYAESYGEKTRTVYLLGEANFKVRKNANVPFIVKSKDFSVTALGTEFDVSSYPDDANFKATLISGSVKVRQQGSPADYILNVNEQFVYSKQNKQRSVARVDIYEATAWQRGELVFNGATINEILNVLERKYAVSFQYKSNILDGDRYNFRFKKESALPDILYVIKKVADDFDYKKIDDLYYINSKK